MFWEPREGKSAKKVKSAPFCTFCTFGPFWPPPGRDSVELRKDSRVRALRGAKVIFFALFALLLILAPENQLFPWGKVDFSEVVFLKNILQKYFKKRSKKSDFSKPTPPAGKVGISGAEIVKFVENAFFALFRTFSPRPENPSVARWNHGPAGAEKQHL